MRQAPKIEVFEGDHVTRAWRKNTLLYTYDRMRSARMQTAPAPAPNPSLRRLLGKWDLTALGVNQVIGGAIFLIPSQLAAQAGNWSPIAFVLAGVASLFVALCFAELGSRFDNTGGPYLYTRAAFGPF